MAYCSFSSFPAQDSVKLRMMVTRYLWMGAILSAAGDPGGLRAEFTLSDEISTRSLPHVLVQP